LRILQFILGIISGLVPLAGSGTLIVANMADNTASLIDIASRRTVATLPTGAGPHEVAVSHDGRWAVVSNYGVRGAPGNTLTVIDVVKATVERTIDLGEYRRPHSAVFLPGDSLLAVTSEASRVVVLVNFVRGGVAGTVATNGGGSHMQATTADGRRMFVSNVGDGTLSELDLAARTYVRTLPLAPKVEGLAATARGDLVFAGSPVAKTVSVVDTRTGAITRTYDGFGFPYRMAVTNDGKLAFICDPPQSKIRVVDIATLAELASIDVPLEGIQATAEFAGQAAPEGLIMGRDGRTFYVALQGSSRVAEVDIATRKLTGYMSTGAAPDGIGQSQLASPLSPLPSRRGGQ
jgi:YVTN family beta-propeller protein